MASFATQLLYYTLFNFFVSTAQEGFFLQRSKSVAFLFAALSLVGGLFSLGVLIYWALYVDLLQAAMMFGAAIVAALAYHFLKYESNVRSYFRVLVPLSAVAVPLSGMMFYASLS